MTRPGRVAGSFQRPSGGEPRSRMTRSCSCTEAPIAYAHAHHRRVALLDELRATREHRERLARMSHLLRNARQARCDETVSIRAEQAPLSLFNSQRR